MVQIHHRRQLFPLLLQPRQPAFQRFHFGFLLPLQRLRPLQTLLPLPDLALPVGAARRGANKTGRPFRTAVSMDGAAAKSPIRQQGSPRPQIGPGDAAQAGKDRFPEARIPIREQAGYGIAHRRFRRQKPVRIFPEQFPDLLHMLLRNHQRVQDPSVGKLRF